MRRTGECHATTPIALDGPPRWLNAGVRALRGSRARASRRQPDRTGFMDSATSRDGYPRLAARAGAHDRRRRRSRYRTASFREFGHRARRSIASRTSLADHDVRLPLWLTTPLESLGNDKHELSCRPGGLTVSAHGGEPSGRGSLRGQGLQLWRPRTNGRPVLHQPETVG